MRYPHTHATATSKFQSLTNVQVVQSCGCYCTQIRITERDSGIGQCRLFFVAIVRFAVAASCHYLQVTMAVVRGFFQLLTLLLQLGLFALAAYWAYDIRDPWFNFRATQYLADNGIWEFFHWFDYWGDQSEPRSTRACSSFLSAFGMRCLRLASKCH
jgi:hypothetical protein